MTINTHTILLWALSYPVRRNKMFSQIFNSTMFSSHTYLKYEETKAVSFFNTVEPSSNIEADRCSSRNGITNYLLYECLSQFVGWCKLIYPN